MNKAFYEELRVQDRWTRLVSIREAIADEDETSTEYRAAAAAAAAAYAVLVAYREAHRA